MAYRSENKLWESEFVNIVSKKDKVQDLNINQLKLQVHDSCEKDKKLTTEFELVNNEDVLNKAYLDEKLLKTNGYLSLLGKDYNEFKLQYNKQSVEQILIQRNVKTTIQILYDKALFDAFPNADRVIKSFLFVKRRRPDLEEVNDNVQ